MAQWSELRRGLMRRDIWEVVITDMDGEDEPYMEAWTQRCGCAWPFVAPGHLHPSLGRLVRAYEYFCADVASQGDALELAIMLRQDVD